MTPKEYALLFARQHAIYERRVYSIFLNALKAQSAPVIAALERGETLTDTDIDLLVRSQPMIRAYQRSYEIIGVMSAKREYLLMRKDNPVKADLLLQFFSEKWALWMREYALSELGDLIQEVTDHTREKIREALAQAYEQGLTFRGQIKLIRDMTTGEIGRSRALTIARTEATRAANEGKRVGATDWASENGTVLYKKWGARLDEKTRPAHIAMEDDLPVLATDSFNVGGEKMSQPGDPSARPGNTVNCRCTVMFMSERTARRDYGV